ncbi:MAG TPA: hypothetical protein PKE26_04635 [Kiritimatiellia bacterium]|nr:hypothetical protein [Kiritimatiellia bacterium]HMO98376.1 hypothetical protein [Kiritimatiellia bacterium]HMP96766.1 hypothetical protein [Kiritimatiellia bacterium]
MKIKTVLLLMSSVLVVGALAEIPEKPAHFKARPSETAEEARDNLSTYSGKLAEILAKEAMTPEDLIEVHRLTYTLEVALEVLRDALENAAGALEEVHLGSETLDDERVRHNGRIYLERIHHLVKGAVASEDNR